MILAVSTSSPLVSMAVVDSQRGIIWQGSMPAPMAASGACLTMLDEMTRDTGITLAAIELFAADVGPGSFTGVRVGVALAKTFGYLHEKPVAGATSFDLISATCTVVLPSKKGEFFVRRVGEKAYRTVELPSEFFRGFGPGIDTPTLPDASRFVDLIGRLQPVSAMDFVPEYLIEPSISIPKTPFASNIKVGG